MGGVTLGGMAVKFGTTANPQQLEAMGHVITAYCKHVGIAPGTPEEKRVAALALELHTVGIRGKAELLGALIVPANRMPKPH
jgi:hypothetical protein